MADRKGFTLEMIRDFDYSHRAGRAGALLTLGVLDPVEDEDVEEATALPVIGTDTGGIGLGLD